MQKLPSLNYGYVHELEQVKNILHQNIDIMANTNKKEVIKNCDKERLTINIMFHRAIREIGLI